MIGMKEQAAPVPNLPPTQETVLSHMKGNHTSIHLASQLLHVTYMQLNINKYY